MSAEIVAGEAPSRVMVYLPSGPTTRRPPAPPAPARPGRRPGPPTPAPPPPPPRRRTRPAPGLPGDEAGAGRAGAAQPDVRHGPSHPGAAPLADEARVRLAARLLQRLPGDPDRRALQAAGDAEVRLARERDERAPGARGALRAAA